MSDTPTPTNTSRGAVRDAIRGYKMTEVGLIPEDWEVTKLGELANFKTGKLDSNASVEDGEYPFFTCSSETFRTNTYSFDTEAVLLAGNNASGIFPIKYYIGKFDAYQRTYVIRSNRASLHNKFLFYALQPHLDSLRNLSTGGATQFLTVNILNKILLITPTLHEQRLIADALSDIDAQITALDDLIAKQRDIKQGAMQRLLTGEERLPGFSGEWKNTTFQEVMTGFSSGMTPSRAVPEYYTGDIPWITSSELDYNIITDTKEKITPEAVVRTNLSILPVGTFLMAITGLEAEGTRGRCGIVGVEATTNQSCMALFPKEGLLTEYLYHYYILNGESLALEYCQGTKQQSYTGKIVKILPINLPPSEDEQRAIAAVLSDMDAEISALEAQRDKMRDVKQGMMQELLAGKTRLV